MNNDLTIIKISLKPQWSIAETVIQQPVWLQNWYFSVPAKLDPDFQQMASLCSNKPITCQILKVMVYFSVYITFNEIIHLQKNLSKDSFCVFQKATGPNCYYGVVKEEVYYSLLHALSAETLQHLEYLNEDEFRCLLSGDPKNRELISCVGNSSLIDIFIVWYYSRQREWANS